MPPKHLALTKYGTVRTFGRQYPPDPVLFSQYKLKSHLAMLELQIRLNVSYRNTVFVIYLPVRLFRGFQIAHFFGQFRLVIHQL
jgi:hypothetical protein